MNEIQGTIANILYIANFWLPGYLFLLIFGKLTGTVQMSVGNVNRHVISVVISLIIRLIALPFYRTDAYLYEQPYYVCAVFCVIGIILALVASAIYRCNGVNRWLSNHFAKSMRQNIWEDAIDFKNGTMLDIELRNGDKIYGGFHTVEESGDSSWLALDRYIVYSEKGEKKPESRNGHLLMIHTYDIVKIKTDPCK